MNVTKSDIEHYLADVFSAVNAGKYQISPRQKNREIFIDYLFTEEDAKKLILSLTVYNFSDVTQNEHEKYMDELLYIFGKEVTLKARYKDIEEKINLYIKLNKISNHYVYFISFHKQEYPLSYKF